MDEAGLAYNEACGGLLDPAEADACGPLQWLHSAIDTLAEPGTFDALHALNPEACDDPDAFLEMLMELRTLHEKLCAALSLARSGRDMGDG